MIFMSKLTAIIAVTVVAAAASVTQLSNDSDAEQAAPQTQQKAAPVPIPKVLTEPSGVDIATEQRVFNEAARSAWAFVEKGYSDRTGLVAAQPTWPYPTVWDMASAIAA